jgi:hypothetical protein
MTPPSALNLLMGAEYTAATKTRIVRWGVWPWNHGMHMTAICCVCLEHV